MSPLANRRKLGAAGRLGPLSARSRFAVKPMALSSTVAFNAGWYSPAATTRQPRGARRRARQGKLHARRHRQAAHRRQARRACADRGPRRRPAVVQGSRRPQGRRRASTLQVGDDWGAGAYVTAMLYRPMDEEREAHAEPRARRRSGWVSTSRPRTLDVKLGRCRQDQVGATA